MELTIELLNDLFPHSDIEYKEDKCVIKAPWCNVCITKEGADVELLHYVPNNWGFYGINWEERLIEMVIEWETMSPFFLIGNAKQGSIHMKSSCYVTEVSHIRSVSKAFYNVWRGWNGELLLCSKHFHHRYLW